jgi:hypothetical protein
MKDSVKRVKAQAHYFGDESRECSLKANINPKIIMV